MSKDNIRKRPPWEKTSKSHSKIVADIFTDPKINNPQYDNDILRPILEIDASLSETLYKSSKKFKWLLTFVHFLEYFLHGLLWLIPSSLYLFFVCPSEESTTFPDGPPNNPYLAQKMNASDFRSHHLWVGNLLLGIILDFTVTGTIKMIVKRQRPYYNTGSIFASIPLDGYSFPSGHSTRSSFLALFFFWVFGGYFPVYVDVLVALVLIFVPISRVMMGRHYVTDVVFGFVIGSFTFFLTMMLWLPLPWIVEIFNQIHKIFPLFGRTRC